MVVIVWLLVTYTLTAKSNDDAWRNHFSGYNSMLFMYWGEQGTINCVGFNGAIKGVCVYVLCKHCSSAYYLYRYVGKFDVIQCLCM